MASTTAIRLTQSYAADGVSGTELRQLLRAGDLARVRHGAYTGELGGDAESRHRQLIAATMPRLGADTYLSHASAALLHGLPTWPEQLDRVHVTKSRPNGGRRARSVHVHPALLPEVDRIELEGFPATSLARTAADTTRMLSYQRGVALADAALRCGLTPDALLEQLEAAPGRRGFRKAVRVTAFADGRAESVGESFSRVALAQLNLPSPELQLEVFDDLGRLVARSDFGWREHRTLAEFDGKVKYGRLLKPGETAGDVIVAEKRREDMLRDLGWEIVRWMWEDLSHPELIAGRLYRAFQRAARR